MKECLSKKKLPGYIGIIGAKGKVADKFSHLKEQGITEELLARVNAPIGLDIESRTPAEIALSIMAEIIAHRHGKNKKEDWGR